MNVFFSNIGLADNVSVLHKWKINLVSAGNLVIFGNLVSVRNLVIVNNLVSVGNLEIVRKLVLAENLVIVGILKIYSLPY